MTDGVTRTSATKIIVRRKSTKLKKFKQPKRTLVLIIGAFVEFYLLTREKHQDIERTETKLESFQK